MKVFSNHLRRVSALLLVLCLLLGTVGCGSSDASGDPSEASSVESSVSESSEESSEESNPEDDPAYIYSLYTQTVEYGFDHMDYPEYAVYRSYVYDDQGKLIRSAQYKYTDRRGDDPQYHYLSSLTFYDENERAYQCLVFNLYREVTQTQTFEYDEAGLMIKKTISTDLGDGSTYQTFYEYAYDDAGKVVLEERYHLNGDTKNVYYKKTYEYDEYGIPSVIKLSEQHSQKNSYFSTTYVDGHPTTSYVYKDSGKKVLDYTIIYGYNDDVLVYKHYISTETDGKDNQPIEWVEFFPMTGQFDFEMSNNVYKRHSVEMIQSSVNEQGIVNRIDLMARNSYTNEVFSLAYREYLENQPLTRKDFYLYQILTIDEINDLKIKEPYEIEEEETPIEEFEIERPQAQEIEITLDNYSDYFEIVPTTVCYSYNEFNDTELFYPYGLTLNLNEDYIQSYLLNSYYYIPEHSSSFVGYELEEISYLLKQNDIAFEPIGHIECTLQLTITDPDAAKLFGWTEKTITCKIGSFEYAKFLLDYTDTIDNAWEDCFPSILSEIYSIGLTRSNVDNSTFGPQDDGDSSLIQDYIKVEVVEISGTLPVYQ